MIFQDAVLVLVTLVVYVHGENSHIPSANGEARNEILEVNLNNMFDRSLPSIRKMIIKGGLDPMTMPDQMLSVTNIPGLRGRIHLQKGWVQEASTIRRTGDVIVRYGNKRMEFNLSLGWDVLDTTYSYTMKYLMFTRKGDFNGRFQNIKIQALGSFDLKTRKIDLQFFKIVKIGNFSLKVHGHLTDPILNALTKAMTVFSKELVVREIEYRFEEGIREKIKEVNDFIPEPWS